MLWSRMVAFEKPAGKYPSTIDKRTQLTGKAGLAGPEKCKREDDNSEPSADDNWYQFFKG